MKIQFAYRGILFLLLACCAGCIKNDLPYPYISGNILEFAVSGQLGETTISQDGKTVKVQVCDTVNLKKLRILKLVLTPDATLEMDETLCDDPGTFPRVGFTGLDNLPVSVNTRMNFSGPVPLVVKTYQEYLWTLNVEQVIIRNIRITNQVGEAQFYVKERQVIVYVSKEQDLSNITIESMQLGASVALTEPSASSVHNFTRPRDFIVTAFGESERWTVSVIQTTASVITNDAEPWACFAMLKGGRSTSDQAIAGFEYRKASESNWTLFSGAEITVDGGVFTGKLSKLEPSTAYVYRAVSGTAKGEEKSFTTEAAPVLPNLNFDSWVKKDKTWYPNADASNSFWATGNEGVNMKPVSKESNTSPTDDAVKGKAALLQTIPVALVNLAAGNLFTGTFLTNISDPSSSPTFGREYKGRPTKLHGYYKYKGGTIDVCDNKNANQDKLGKPDMCHIYLRLENRSSGKAETVAYGELKDAATSSAYKKFTITLKYSDQKLKPTHAVLVATSSVYGDLYTGHNGSMLWVDEFELGFD